MGIFYKEFALKKVLECGAAKSWKETKVAEKVYLKTNLDKNIFKDLSKQVGVSIDKEGEKIIGVIPEEEGRFIKDILDMGWDEVFSAVISQNDSTKPLENRFKVAVYIERFIDVKDDVKKKIDEIEKIK